MDKENKNEMLSPFFNLAELQTLSEKNRTGEIADIYNKMRKSLSIVKTNEKEINDGENTRV